MKLRRSFASVQLAFVLVVFGAASPISAVGCSSKSEEPADADASVCPATMPAQGDACTVPLDTRCTFGDACTGAAFVCGKSATWQRGAFTSRCDGG